MAAVEIVKPRHSLLIAAQSATRKRPSIMYAPPYPHMPYQMPRECCSLHTAPCCPAQHYAALGHTARALWLACPPLPPATCHEQLRAVPSQDSGRPDERLTQHSNPCAASLFNSSFLPIPFSSSSSTSCCSSLRTTFDWFWHPAHFALMVVAASACAPFQRPDAHHPPVFLATVTLLTRQRTTQRLYVACADKLQLCRAAVPAMV